MVTDETRTEDLVLSTLPKTWIFDLDGTIVKHNGYKIDGYDTLLDGVKEYIRALPKADYILILTSRTDEYHDMTIDFLKEHDVRYDKIIFNMPMGERIVVNDRKPSGIDMAVAVNVDRDKTIMPKIISTL
ncbi:MAG: hypothetical protein J6I76_14370 [Oribacterium sp.]|nr:hypothetical protein [Oribacterium sp.]